MKKIEIKIHSKQDLHYYMGKLMTIELDRNNLLWEIHVKEDYDDNSSVMFMLSHHILSDEMKNISMMTFMNDSHNPDNITQFK